MNLRGMIRLDQVEDIFSNLMDTVDRQEKKIESLQLLCQNFMDNRVAEERFREVQSGLEEISIKLNRVHTFATSRLDGNE